MSGTPSMSQSSATNEGDDAASREGGEGDLRIIRTPNPQDVLFGRGYVCRDHEGTKNFNALCRSQFPEFMSSKRHEVKNIAAFRVLNSVNEEGGRFLEPHEGGGYIEMNNEQVVKKIKQSIRDALKNQRPSSPASVTGKKKDNDIQFPLPDEKLVERYPPDEVDAARELYTLLSEPEGPIPIIALDAYEEEATLLSETEVKALKKDVFGELCDEPLEQDTKRVKAIALNSLLEEMRLQISTHDNSGILAMVRESNAHEFSDERLEPFLLREDKNPEKAAVRFVRYWRKRRELFGPDRYLSPMTISDMLTDSDLAALRAGEFQILPRKDTSGRPVLFRDYSLDRKDGYTAENSLRALWYLLEVIAQERRKGVVAEFVNVVWCKNMTVWDFDRKANSERFQLEKECLPVYIDSLHVCCAPYLSTTILLPMVFALQEKRTRQRMVIHKVSEREIVGELAKYGIVRDILPSSIGGTAELNPSAWISIRQSLESEVDDER